MGIVITLTITLVIHDRHITIIVEKLSDDHDLVWSKGTQPCSRQAKDQCGEALTRSRWFLGGRHLGAPHQHGLGKPWDLDLTLLFVKSTYYS